MIIYIVLYPKRWSSKYYKFSLKERKLPFSSLGQEYEIKLHSEVTKLNLAFRDEEHLRKCGYDKTPDVKLDVPVAIDGFVVNWIESKALFGDEEVHQEYTQNQYLSYWNRY